MTAFLKEVLSCDVGVEVVLMSIEWNVNCADWVQHFLAALSVGL